MNEIIKNSATKLIVVTGGPGGGKTTILERVKKFSNEKTIVFPEAASIVFGGGFWRLPSVSAKCAAQTAIFHVQREMEKLICSEKKWEVGLCDRGTLDGLAYWPKNEQEFWEMAHSSLQKELNRYYAVIHLHSPTDLFGYNHANPIRTETSLEAKAIDEQMKTIWRNHPRYHSIESTENFEAKVQSAIDIIKKYQQ